MKRDMNFVRQILIEISNDECKTNFKRDNEEDDLYLYHLEIMKQAGLIDFKVTKYGSGAFIYDRPILTWYGNDYLDAISNDTVWNKTKEMIKSKGLEIGQVTFDLMIEYAKLQIKNILGML